METIIKDNESTRKINIEADLSAFYKEIGQILSNVPIPNSVSISCEHGDAEYDVTTRSGTRLISERRNSIDLPQNKAFGERYLVMVNAAHNNYKFYRLKQDKPHGDVTASWGRIGTKPGEQFGERSCTYPANMFWVKYFEKTSKGYEDKSNIYLNDKPVLSKTSPDVKKNAVSQASVDLFALMKKFAKHTIDSTTRVSSANVTEMMVKESKKLLNQLYDRKTVNGFNNKLMELMSICPRQVSRVQSLLAKDKSDFAQIIAREENLVDAMSALVCPIQSNSNTESFNMFDTEVYTATDKQKAEVLRHLDPSLQSKVKNIYRVINKNHKERFNKYLKDHSIDKVKQLWHGSRNENWITIIRDGLLLKPNAIITGKMFGNGIYFAPKSTKSWNYTSFRGTSWAKGSSDTAFMGLYAVAYGNPLDCYTAHSYTPAELARNNADCVHAHAGSALLNDEIIFYDEAAMLLNYIVEFGA